MMKLIATVLLVFGFSFLNSASAQEDAKAVAPQKPSLEFQLGVGPTIRTGAQPKNGAVMELAAGAFPGRAYWGAVLTIVGDFKSSDNSFGFVGVGLAYRNEIGERWRWMYDVGPALGMNFRDNGTTTYSLYGERPGKSIGTFLALLQRIQLNYIFSTGTLGVAQSEYGIGLGVIHTHSDGYVHGTDFSGDTIAFSLHFTLGL